MKRKSKSLACASVALLLALVTAVGLFSAGCKSKDGNASEYTVTYVANYAGGQDMQRVYAKGARINRVEMYRTGYKLEGWYTDRATSEKRKYDFSQKLSGNLNLFAKWTEVSTDLCTVTFDYNYTQSPDPIRIFANKGENIAEDRLPQAERFGFEAVGWYTDAACTTPFDVNAAIQNDITLYAKYSEATGLRRNGTTGVAELENVKIKLWIEGDDYGLQTAAEAAVAKFNAANSGKIEVEVTTDASRASGLNVKFRPMEKIASNARDYYTVADALTIAGLTFDDTQYYGGQVDDCYRGGRLIGYPVGSIVPAALYNKSLAGSDTIATAAQAKAKAAQVAQQNGKFGASLDAAWSGYEIAVHNAFVQNGADYWVKSGDKNVNLWKSDIGKPYAAVTALRDLIAPAAVTKTLDDVKNGNGFLWLSGRAGEDWSEGLGVVPVSGLFASGENADKIYVKNYALGISVSGNKYRAGVPDDNGTPRMEAIAASAILVKYLAENMDLSTAKGIYPAYKPLQESVLAADTPMVNNVLRNVGSPEKFVCYPYCPNGAAIMQGGNGSGSAAEKDQTKLKRQKAFFDGILASDATEADLKELITEHGKFISAMISA